MKKVIILLALFSFCGLAQDLFLDKNKNEYLFIGSKEGDNIKLLNINDKSITWNNKNLLQQIDRLQPKIFLTKVLEAGMVFTASGDEPFWEAKIGKNEIDFFSSDINSEKIAIKLDMSEFSIDSTFLLMFHAEGSQNIYGLIRGLTDDSVCDLNIDDEQSIFEIFISYRAQTFKGCAILTRQ